MAAPDAWWCEGTISCDTTPQPARETDLFISISAAYWVGLGGQWSDGDNRAEAQQCPSMQ